jgi:putative transposase
MCRVLRVERSGFYAWMAQPRSARAIEDRRLLELIEVAYEDSGGVYGSRNIHRELTEAAERLGRKRVERLMRAHGLRSVRAPQRRRHQTGKPAIAAPNRLDRPFTVQPPDQAWVTDITSLRTAAEAWLYLAVVLDLYSHGRWWAGP